MITLTPRAASQIRLMQQDAAAPTATDAEAAAAAGQEKLLRVLVEHGGCSGLQYGMSFDVRKDGDTEIESEGVRLLMDPDSLAHMRGSQIDFDDGLQGKGFEIQNPNAKTTCGCGKSFS